MKRVGILGGGQLCLMLADALERLDAQVVVFDPDPECPAKQRLRDVVTAGFDDAAALEAFYSRVDVVTYEWENVPVEPLRAHAHRAPMLPSIDVLATTQDRASEKKFLRDNGFPCVRHAFVAERELLAEAARAFGFPCILKTSRGGYDGKGQWLLKSDEDVKAVPAKSPLGAGWVLEEPIDIAAEVSCIVARSADGVQVAFPVFRNHHTDHVLDFTVVPASIDAAIANRVRDISLGIARGLDVVGLVTVELFISKSSTVYVNELAPRPHNSGHVTRKACTLSQYDALARVLTGVPLAQPELIGPGVFCMANLLGDIWLAAGTPDLDLRSLAHHPEVVEVYLYGKRAPARRRKMGHFVVRVLDDASAVGLVMMIRSGIQHASSRAERRGRN